MPDVNNNLSVSPRLSFFPSQSISLCCMFSSQLLCSLIDSLHCKELISRGFLRTGNYGLSIFKSINYTSSSLSIILLPCYCPLFFFFYLTWFFFFTAPSFCVFYPPRSPSPKLPLLFIFSVLPSFPLPQLFISLTSRLYSKSAWLLVWPPEPLEHDADELNALALPVHTQPSSSTFLVAIAGPCTFSGLLFHPSHLCVCRVFCPVVLSFLQFHLKGKNNCKRAVVGLI